MHQKKNLLAKEIAIRTRCSMFISNPINQQVQLASTSNFTLIKFTSASSTCQFADDQPVITGRISPAVRLLDVVQWTITAVESFDTVRSILVSPSKPKMVELQGESGFKAGQIETRVSVSKGMPQGRREDSSQKRVRRVCGECMKMLLLKPQKVDD